MNPEDCEKHHNWYLQHAHLDSYAVPDLDAQAEVLQGKLDAVDNLWKLGNHGEHSHPYEILRHWQVDQDGADVLHGQVGTADMPSVATRRMIMALQRDQWTTAL